MKFESINGKTKKRMIALETQSKKGITSKKAKMLPKGTFPTKYNHMLRGVNNCAEGGGIIMAKMSRKNGIVISIIWSAL